MRFTKLYDEAEPQRINKWLGQSGVCSRREAEGLIERGLVYIDDECVTDMGRKINKGQTLSLMDEAMDDLAARLSILYNKPSGIVSGQPEPGKIPAIRMIKPDNRYANDSDRLISLDRHSSLAPVGRLDEDSRGLLILSDDGVLAKAIIGPQSKIDKSYHVRVRGEVSAAKLAWLRHGLELDGRALKPAKVEQTGGQTLHFILSEGRNRQIRRMCEMVELGVSDLFRDRIGPIDLGDLPEGQWRVLTDVERQTLIAKG